MKLSPLTVQIVHLLNDSGDYPVSCTSEASQRAAETLRDAGIVNIEARLVPRFPDNGRAIYTLQQEQLRVVAYFLTFTDKGRLIYGTGQNVI